MKKEKIIIGSRGSKLALIYAQKVKNEIIKSSDLREDQLIIKPIVTKGDQVLDKRLSEMGGKGLFSKNIESELIDGNIHIAVHALKDMPIIETEGLLNNFFLKRNDPREILISKDKKKLKDLKPTSIIGTSSFRREFQIKSIRNDVLCKLIRGNVDTRLKKLRDGSYDAIVLSSAGIKALKLEKEIDQIFLIQEIIPSAGQGVIAMQCRDDDSRTIDLLKKVNDIPTSKCALAERDVLRILEGDCETAIGVHALLKDDQITLEAELFSLDGSERFYEKNTKDIKDFDKIGVEIGKILKEKSKGSYKK
ncbi:hydroxymethylbilane synthase [Candidatus Pelagibacter communis]|uniref:hydroxymethylbilane synthase n=1 Tax=Pelagibacter ubique TaxID=198252 RepID=UPI00094CB9A9|nr:hydroxymethylbilane synthase [Candidatus Pelagibacter ubique]